jgi:hypothetical protein
MSISKDTLVDALRLRYDSYSAETIFELACTRADLEGKTSFEAKEMPAFRAALEKVGDRVGNVLARIDEIAGTGPAKPTEAKSDGKPEAKAESDSKPTEAKSDGKPEAKSDGKPEAKADSKPNETKAESKPNDAKSESKPNEAKAKGDAKSEGKGDAKSEGKGDAKSDAKAKGDGKPVETTIVLRGVDAKDDEQIMVCGALSELGDWDPERARAMVREGDQWLTTFKLAPDSEISFKLLRKNAAGAITWEAGDNRQVRASQRLDVTWRTA